MPVWYWLGGSISIISALLILLLGGQANKLTCNRVTPAQGTCQLETSVLLLGSIVENVPLADLKGAEIKQEKGTRSTNYYVVLLRSQGKITLTGNVGNYGASYNYKQRIVSQINAFVKDTTATSLRIEDNPPWGLLLFCSLFIVGGFYLAVIEGQIIILTLDKIEERITMRKIGLLGIQVIQHPLSRISDIKLEEMTSHKGFYRINFMLDEGSQITLPPSSKKNREKQYKVIEALQNFLNQ